MAFIIIDTCVRCDACLHVCPRIAVSAGPETYTIDAERCDECADLDEAPYCLQVCPAECICPADAQKTGVGYTH